MPTEPAVWMEFMKTFGWPLVFLAIVGFIYFKTNQWIQNTLVGLVGEVKGTISTNTEAMKKVLEALDKRQPGSL